MAVPGGVSGQGRHNATVGVANILLHGFALQEADAYALLTDYNRKCVPPSPDDKLRYRFQVAKDFQNDKPSGWLVDSGNAVYGDSPAVRQVAVPKALRMKPEFDLQLLKNFAGDLARETNLVWLANRSELDPALVDSAAFLTALYRQSEKVLIFTDEMSQGQSIWPDEPLPTAGPHGVWYLAQPVDGGYHPNPRSKDKDGRPKMSRRSEESVTDWRWMVIESDTAPLSPWLAALAKLPMRIGAIYTSGGRSIHALVRVDCLTKSQWDGQKHAMKHGLIVLGADPGAMSAVRLTRLPGCRRDEKKAMQKLLYLQPNPQLRPLLDCPVLRDVEADWLARASVGIANSDEGNGQWLKDGLGYYANVSDRCRAALENFKKEGV